MKKNEAMLLSLDSIEDRLLPIGVKFYPINVERPTLDFLFSRYLLSAVYMGNPPETYSRPGPEWTHGINDFMCLTLNHHTHGPENPGALGLYFASGHDLLEPIE